MFLLLLLFHYSKAMIADEIVHTCCDIIIAHISKTLEIYRHLRSVFQLILWFACSDFSVIIINTIWATRTSCIIDGTAIVQWLAHCTANLRILDLNPAHIRVCEMFLFGVGHSSVIHPRCDVSSEANHTNHYNHQMLPISSDNYKMWLNSNACDSVIGFGWITVISCNLQLHIHPWLPFTVIIIWHFILHLWP